MSAMPDSRVDPLSWAVSLAVGERRVRRSAAATAWSRALGVTNVRRGLARDERQRDGAGRDDRGDGHDADARLKAHGGVDLRRQRKRRRRR